MQTVFDPSIVDSYLSAAQLSQADVARALKVSREAVSNWMSGDAVPRPRHRALLAALVGVSVSALGVASSKAAEPVVAYRVKANRKVKTDQAEWIMRDVRWLGALEKRLSASGWLERPPEHRGLPTGDQARLVAASFRKELGLDDQDEVIAAHRLLSWIAGHGICLVPVFWGAKEQPLQAMYVRLPDSGFNWLYVNLDAAAIDVRFWLLHEIAHIIRRHPHDAGSVEETFADTFAAEVLFPSSHAADFLHFHEMETTKQFETIQRLAQARGISSVTVYRQVNHVLEQAGLSRLQLDGIVYPRALVHAKRAPTWADGLFGGPVPTGRRFVNICTERLGTPVFCLAAREIVENNRAPGFVERVFQCGSADAMALHEALREYGTANDPR